MLPAHLCARHSAMVEGSQRTAARSRTPAHSALIACGRPRGLAAAPPQQSVQHTHQQQQQHPHEDAGGQARRCVDAHEHTGPGPGRHEACRAVWGVELAEPGPDRRRGSSVLEGEADGGPQRARPQERDWTGHGSLEERRAQWYELGVRGGDGAGGKAPRRIAAGCASGRKGDGPTARRGWAAPPQLRQDPGDKRAEAQSEAQLASVRGDLG